MQHNDLNDPRKTIHWFEALRRYQVATDPRLRMSSDGMVRHAWRPGYPPNRETR